MAKKKLQLERQQGKLGIKGLIFFIVLMDMFIPLSTDMYLPALPTMGEHLMASDAVIKFSVTGFFIFYAAGMLIWGPLSDKFGRKRPLIVGYLLYCLASLVCALSINAWMLIISRIFQGIGAASVTSISMAMVKDCFLGKRREVVLAIVQTFSGFGPIIAPVIGGWILLIAEWRDIFLLLFMAGIAGLVLTFLYEESLQKEERLQGKFFQSFVQINVVIRNKTFLWLVLIYGVLNIAFYMYLTLSSYIYVDQFGCSEQDYSYYYAACALLALAGPVVYIRVFQEQNKKLLVFVCLGTCFISGIGICTIGLIHPAIFCLMMFLFYFFTNILRPFFTNITLEQEKDVGTASSVMNMIYNGFGSVGMLISSISVSNMAASIGVAIALTSFVSVAMWWYLMHTEYQVKGLYYK